MGGTTGTPAEANPNTLAGSRSVLSKNPTAAPVVTTPSTADFSSWLASVPQWAGTQTAAQVAAGKSLTPAMLSNPTGQAVEVGGTGSPIGFQSHPYNQPTAALPHIGAPDKAAAAEAAKPKPFPKPTSFSNSPFIVPHDARFVNTSWYTNPELVREYSQAWADAGWDYTDPEVNPWHKYLGGKKVYWPGEPRS